MKILGSRTEVLGLVCGLVFGGTWGCDKQGRVGDPAPASGGGKSDDTRPGPAAHSRLRLYVAGGKSISVWDADPVTGALSPIETRKQSMMVGPLVADPSKRFLYAALGRNRVRSYAVDPDDGTLSDVDQLMTRYEAVYLWVDHSGEHLLMADMAGDRIEIYPVDQGAIGDKPTASVATCSRPHAVVMDETDIHVFVPCRDGDVIEQYLFDRDSGTLTSNEPPNVAIPEGTGPRHLVLHADLGRAYLAGETNSTLNVLDYDPGAGTLSFASAVTTVPDGTGANTTAEVRMTPDGEFLYVSNRGHDSLASFGLTNKGPSPLRISATEPTPRAFEISPCGRLLYAAGQESGRLASYAIEEDGDLTAGEVYDVGAQPMWVLALELPAPQ